MDRALDAIADAFRFAIEHIADLIAWIASHT